MPQSESANVDVRMPSGRIAHIPRESLVKAKTLGAIEIEKEKEEHTKTYDFGKEVARGMGFDPEKIERLGGKSQKMQLIETARQFLTSTGKWMDVTIRDPAHITDPFESVASGLESGV